MLTSRTTGRHAEGYRIGTLWIDASSFSQALEEIERLVDGAQGGAVFTPNVDHVIKAESNLAFRRAYGRCESVARGRDAAGVGWGSVRLSAAREDCGMPIS